MLSQGGDEMQGVESLAQHLVQDEQRRRIILQEEGVHQPETILVIEDSQIPDDILIFDIRPAESHGLVENRKRIAHGAIGLLGNHMKRSVIGIYALLGSYRLEIAHDI